MHWIIGSIGQFVGIFERVVEFLGRPQAKGQFRQPRHAVLVAMFQKQRQRYEKAPQAAARLLSIGDSEADSTLDPIELAAWTTVASTILNLDEVITKG